MTWPAWAGLPASHWKPCALFAVTCSSTHSRFCVCAFPGSSCSPPCLGPYSLLGMWPGAGGISTFCSGALFLCGREMDLQGTGNAAEPPSCHQRRRGLPAQSALDSGTEAVGGSFGRPACFRVPGGCSEVLSPPVFTGPASIPACPSSPAYFLFLDSCPRSLLSLSPSLPPSFPLQVFREL